MENMKNCKQVNENAIVFEQKDYFALRDVIASAANGRNAGIINVVLGQNKLNDLEMSCLIDCAINEAVRNLDPSILDLAISAARTRFKDKSMPKCSMEPWQPWISLHQLSHDKRDSQEERDIFYKLIDPCNQIFFGSAISSDAPVCGNGFTASHFAALSCRPHAIERLIDSGYFCKNILMLGMEPLTVFIKLRVVYDFENIHQYRRFPSRRQYIECAELLWKNRISTGLKEMDLVKKALNNAEIGSYDKETLKIIYDKFV